jgi:DNA-binding transcriptional LysR family regulator
LRGRLRVAAPLSFGPTHLAPVLAELARRHPLLHVHACYGDRFVDVVGEGFDCAVRVGYLADSNLVARRIGPVGGKLVASPDYIRRHGTPETPDDLVSHEALLQGTETWRLIDGDKTVTVHPQGRFKAVVTLILIIMGAMALVTQALGVQSVLGAFVAGLLVGESPILTKHIATQLRGMITAFFAPIFSPSQGWALISPC